MSGVSKKPSFSIARPKGINEAEWDYFRNIKEVLDQYEGVSGEEGDGILCIVDLEKIGLDKNALASDTASYDFRILNASKIGDVTPTINHLLVANGTLWQSSDGSYFLDSDNFTGTEWVDLTDGGDTTLHDHDGISENTTHRTSDGSNHTFIDQSVIDGAAPVFDLTNCTDLPSSGVSVGNTITTLADDATPSVLDGRYFVTGGTTTITDFDEGVAGQEINIIAAHSVTITNNSNIALYDGVNFDMVVNDVLTLICKADLTWVRKTGSVNSDLGYDYVIV